MCTVGMHSLDQEYVSLISNLLWQQGNLGSVLLDVPIYKKSQKLSVYIYYYMTYHSINMLAFFFFKDKV